MGDQSKSVLFHSLQGQLQELENENMNLKMETANLQERVATLVGGDLQAMDFERDNFSLRKSMMDMETEIMELKRQRDVVQEAHTKAMVNLMKLDQGWKASTKTLSSVEMELNENKERYEKAQENIHIQTVRITGLEETKSRVMTENTILQEENTLQKNKMETNTLLIRELQSRLEMQENANQSSDMKSQSEVQILVAKYQTVSEECAGLRGEVKGLRHELQMVTSELENAATMSENDQSKLIALTEETSSLRVQLNSSKQQKIRVENENSSSTLEVQRLLQELEKKSACLLDRDSSLSQLVATSANGKKQLDKKQQEDVKQWEMERNELQNQLETNAKSACDVIESKDTALSLWYSEVHSVCMILHQDGELKLNHNDSSPQECVLYLKMEAERIQKTLCENEASVSVLEKKDRNVDRLKVKVEMVTNENEKLRGEYEKVRDILQRMTSRHSNKENPSTKRVALADKANTTTAVSKRPLEKESTRRVAVKSRYMDSKPRN